MEKLVERKERQMISVKIIEINPVSVSKRNWVFQAKISFDSYSITIEDLHFSEYDYKIRICGFDENDETKVEYKELEVSDDLKKLFFGQLIDAIQKNKS